MGDSGTYRTRPHAFMDISFTRPSQCVCWDRRWMDRYTAKDVCSCTAVGLAVGFPPKKISTKGIEPGMHTRFSPERVLKCFRVGGMDTLTTHSHYSITCLLYYSPPPPSRMCPLPGMLVPASKDLRTHTLTLERRSSVTYWPGINELCSV